MRNDALGRIVLVGVCALATPSALHAQSVRWSAGGGAIMPLGAYGDADNPGWHLLGTLDRAIAHSPVSVGMSALYGRTTHRSGVNGDSELAAGLADLVWRIRTPLPSARVYFVAGAGIGRVHTALPAIAFSASETKVALSGGAGVTIGSGPVRFFVEGRYLSVREGGGASTDVLPVTAGVTLGAP